MEPGVVERVTTIAGLLGVPADHPTLGKALEKYACPLSNMRISPLEPVYLVRVRGREHIVRAAALNGHRAKQKSAADMRLAVAKVLGIDVQRLRDEWDKYEGARRLRLRNREHQMA